VEVFHSFSPASALRLPLRALRELVDDKAAGKGMGRRWACRFATASARLPFCLTVPFEKLSNFGEQWWLALPLTAEFVHELAQFSSL